MKKLLALCLCLGLCSSANADYMLVDSRSDMSNDGLINWGDLTIGTTQSNPFDIAVSGIPGLEATVSQSGNPTIKRANEGNGWTGNFSPGATLLLTSSSSDPLEITFSSPVSGAGSQFETFVVGGFTARISAFDADDKLLISFDFNGVSKFAAPGVTAVFAGIVSSSKDISKIRFEGISALQDPNDFAIGNVTVQNEPLVSAVPEPMSLITFSGLFVGLAGMVRMQRQTKPAQA